ncbi:MULTISPECIES: hypothetical protein [Bradyrhizobium]|uniref:Uncharacterized protein n=1 Tax=Bradyrhizobium barranii subsp. barranii TaxID=2823807 RepID=A0A939M288_9BRAD|nr:MULTISPECIES: hypothetical protein [Bradyrhizobium]MCP1747537.1 hypothetical protein [Bradyrhizobium japonicum]MCP1865187.1 hypothetical protein [Bradyrhizobium japonicum]MCP1896040.1 hypothetical protein [Bradyrhizobium japonicum]MCW2329426.1 hypothetical protein [Bradyrhizobium japonicum]UEM12420.1 hypothetical protein J4G43_049910 [Bradyrhizobium barranii subsp. barranii]
MEFRPDGRKYARITRKSAELITLLRRGNAYELDSIVALIESQKSEEFFLKNLAAYISSERVREYLRFLVALGVLSEADGAFTLGLNPKPTSDIHKIQLLADRARRFLATQLNVPPASVATDLQTRSGAILRKGELATLDKVAASASVSGNRAEEFFRWAVYMLLDDPGATLSLSRSPVLVSGNGKRSA